MQSEGLVSAICYLGLLFKSIPAGVVVEPQQIAMDVGHLARDDDLVAVEVVEVVDLLLAFAFCGCQVADLCQGFVCTVMPYVGIGSFMWATACLYFLLH